MIYDHPIYRTCLRKNLAKQDCQWLRDENFITCPCSSGGKVSACNAGDLGSIPGSRRSPWRRKWQPTPVFMPEESHGQRSLVDSSPQVARSWTWLKWRSTHAHPVFHSGCTRLSSHQQHFSTPPPALVTCRLLTDGHSDWLEVIPHCSFDLHFSNN